MQYRVKQVSDNIFIPQCKEWYSVEWSAIDNIENFIWVNTEKYSHNKTIEAALKVIENHKKYLKEKTKYPKYFKV